MPDATALQPPPGALEDPKVLLSWIVGVLLAALLAMFLLRERMGAAHDAETKQLLAEWKAERDGMNTRWAEVREETTKRHTEFANVLATMFEFLKDRLK